MSVREDAILVLKFAREDILTPGGWMQHDLGCYLVQSGPVCVMGAVLRHGTGSADEVLVEEVLTAEAVKRGYEHPAAFNDDPFRTVDDVAEFIDAGIHRLEEMD